MATDTPGASGVIIRECWQLQEQIGKGSFAVVFKAKHIVDGRLAAVKEISTEKLNSKLQESLESEVAVLLRAKHPNIIKLHDVQNVRRDDAGSQSCRHCASHGCF